jgi:hypothetical protein
MTSSDAASWALSDLAKWKSILLAILLVFLFVIPAQASEDSQEIKRCRSIVAEAAFLVELWSQGDVTDTFARGLLKTAEEQLASSVNNPDLNAAVRDELRAASYAMEARDAGTLKRISNELYARDRQDE